MFRPHPSEVGHFAQRINADKLSNKIGSRHYVTAKEMDAAGPILTNWLNKPRNNKKIILATVLAMGCMYLAYNIKSVKEKYLQTHLQSVRNMEKKSESDINTSTTVKSNLQTHSQSVRKLEKKSDTNTTSKTVKQIEASKSIFERHRITKEEEVDFRVIVMTFNRPESVARCLESLNHVDYFGDKVHIDIWIDRSKKDGSIDNKTFEAVSSFKFKHGTAKVNLHPKHVGIYGQWLATWFPREDTREIVLLAEDDLTFSKHLYKWLKLVHKKYDSVPYINGFSTQGVCIKHGVSGKGLIQAPKTEVVYSLAVLGSWGHSPKPKHWLKFLAWFDEKHADPKFKPTVKGLKASGWYSNEARHGPVVKMWTMWHVCYAHENKHMTVYSNFPSHQGLSINWKEPGLHFHGKRPTKNSDKALMEWDERYGDLPDEPVQLDVNGVVAKPAVRHKQ